MAVGHVDHHVLARPTGGPPIQVHVVHVGDEVCLHEAIFDLGGLTAEVEFVVGIESVAELHRAVEDEFRAAVQVERSGCVRSAVETYRLIAARVVNSHATCSVG